MPEFLKANEQFDDENGLGFEDNAGGGDTGVNLLNYKVKFSMND
jgi:hypothetical protein